MKKIFSLGIILFGLLYISATFAEVGGTVTRTATVPTYTTAEDFLAAEWYTCEVATDGCNTITVRDGKFGISTMRYCEQDPIYSCTQQRQEIKVCTMEYAPVCGVDAATYSNSCMAGDVEVAYEWVCEAKDNLSENDRNFYNQIQTQLDEDYVVRVEKVIGAYAENMKRKRWARERMLEAHDSMIERVDTMISKLLMKYPQDIALPERANERYLKLSLIKLSLMDLDL